MSDQITTLPISALRECPTNPRTSYNPAKLAELAESIKAQGILQPIVVRSLYPAGAPTQAAERYEVVFGHRRLRAAKLADLQYDGVPCIIRDMADDQVAIAQLVENAQREDVSALDEAESFRRLMEDHKVKVADIIRQTGKSKSYVYARLKLLHLDPKVKAAMVDGTLDAEIGVLISRLPLAVHAEALDEVTMTVDGKDETVSYREARRTLQGYLVDLSAAPFSLTATDFSATGPACTKCQRRSGNNPDLQGELGENTCTSRSCFEAKCVVFVQRRINAAKEAGQQVIEGDQARQVQYSPHSPWLSGYKTLDDLVATELGAAIKVRDLLDQCGAPAPALALLAHPEAPTKVIEVLSHDAVNRMRRIAAGEDPDAPAQQSLGNTSPPSGQLVPPGLPADDNASGDEGEDEDEDAPTWPDKAPEARAVLRPDTWSQVRAAIRRRVRTTPRTALDLRFILMRELELANEFPEAVYQAFGWHDALQEADDPQDFLQTQLQQLGPDDLAAILTLLAIENMNESYIAASTADTHAAKRLALAAAYGVDPLKPTDQ